MDKPDQRPEGVLLSQALKASGLSARKAAEKIGISDTRLRHIVNGYQPVGRGQFIEITSPADTLARAARVLGVDPVALRTAGRNDAADELERINTHWMGVEDADFDSDVRTSIAEMKVWLDDRTGEDPPPQSALSLFEDYQIIKELGSRLQYFHDYIRELSRKAPADVSAPTNPAGGSPAAPSPTEAEHYAAQVGEPGMQAVLDDLARTMAERRGKAQPNG